MARRYVINSAPICMLVLAASPSHTTKTACGADLNGGDGAASWNLPDMAKISLFMFARSPSHIVKTACSAGLLLYIA